MLDIDKTTERVKESAKWQVGYCPPNLKTIQSDALTLVSEVERLRVENDSYAVAIQEWAMSQPQVEIANLQITVSDLKAELENVQDIRKELVGDAAQRGNELASALKSIERYEAELAKAQEKIKELEALAKAVYAENSKSSYGSEEQSSNIHNLIAKHFWPNDSRQWS